MKFLSTLVQQIRDTDWYFRIFWKDTSNLAIEGNCQQTGNCCKNLILVHGTKPIRTRKQFEKYKRIVPYFSMFQPHDAPGEDGLLRFRCSNLTDNNLCGIYETRPKLCREYPHAGVLSRAGGGLLPGCGYKLVPKKPFEEFVEKRSSTLKIID